MSKSFHPFNRQIMARFSLGVFLFIGFLSTVYLAEQQQDVRNQAATQDLLIELPIEPVVPEPTYPVPYGSPTLRIPSVTPFPTVTQTNSSKRRGPKPTTTWSPIFRAD